MKNHYGLTLCLDNIYAIFPPPGTIIDEATDEEMKKAIRHMAFMRLQDMNIQFDGASYKELLKEFQDFEADSCNFWRGVARCKSVPYEWPIRIDHANGPIYVGGLDLYDGENREVESDIYA